MAQRSFWKGHLKLSLVTCPVAMMPATSDSEKVRFHTLNRATGNRVEARYVDAVTGRVVAEDDEAKGYERDADNHVILEEDELRAVALESTRTIDIDMFVPKDSIEWIWYDTPHFLVPDDPVGEEAFSVIREAMAASGMVGIARLVLYRRERAVMLEPRGRGIVLWTLRYGDEVRPPGDYFAGIAHEKIESEQLSLITALIEKRTRKWDPAMLRDPVQENLQKIIVAKKKGRTPVRKVKDAPRAGNVVSITEALKKSIAAEKAGRR